MRTYVGGEKVGENGKKWVEAGSRAVRMGEA